jgi:hypothetical protein
MLNSPTHRFSCFFVLLLCCLCLNATASNHELHEAYLRRLVGQWKGHYTLATLFGKTLGSYRIEQSYYWHKGHLMGASAVELPNGGVQYEYSEAWFDGIVYRSIVESETALRHYYGWMHERSVWWQSSPDDPNTFHQLHREQLEPTLNGFILTMNGYQWSTTGRKSEFLLVRATFNRLTTRESFDFLETAP